MSGDVVWHCGQALAAGGARGMDESLERLGDLDGPVLAGVGSGGVSKISEQVLAAELVAQAGKLS